MLVSSVLLPSVTLSHLPNMWRKSKSSSPSRRYIAPPEDGIVVEEEEAVPDLQAKARRRGASVALSLDVQKHDAAENKPVRRLSRRRASVQALEQGGGGAVAGGAASGGAPASPADNPNDRDGRRLSDRSARRLPVSNSLITAAAQAEDRRREETDVEAAARAEGALVKLRKIGTIAAVASQRAKLWAGRHHAPQPQSAAVA